ncbi:MAG: hypothetical protein HYX22_01535 [Candidatus Yanofskybacteria bacterium]|nr:hypothetical protein [Candidatus Yanofskybacteria bacterium]
MTNIKEKLPPANTAETDEISKEFQDMYNLEGERFFELEKDNKTLLKADVGIRMLLRDKQIKDTDTVSQLQQVVNFEFVVSEAQDEWEAGEAINEVIKRYAANPNTTKVAALLKIIGSNLLAISGQISGYKKTYED